MKGHFFPKKLTSLHHHPSFAWVVTFTILLVTIWHCNVPCMVSLVERHSSNVQKKIKTFGKNLGVQGLEPTHLGPKPSTLLAEQSCSLGTVHCIHNCYRTGQDRA